MTAECVRQRAGLDRQLHAMKCVKERVMDAPQTILFSTTYIAGVVCLDIVSTLG